MNNETTVQTKGRFTPNRNFSFREAQQEDTLTLNLSDIGRILRRNIWLIALCTVLGGGVASFLVLRITPVYMATAQILLGQGSRADDALGTLFQGMDRDSSEIYGEISTMTSGRFLSRVSETLALSTLPEFNPALQPAPAAPGMIQTAVTTLKSTVKRVLRSGDAVPPAVTGDGIADPTVVSGADRVRSAAEAEQIVRGDQSVYVDTLARRLSVRQQGLSSVLDIRFMSSDPLVAAAVVNTVADQYIAFQLEDKLSSVQRVTDGLNERIADMRQRLGESERGVIAFRSDSLGSDADWMDQQLRELSSRLVEARAERSELEAEREQIASLIAEQGAEAAVGVLESDLIRKLQQERSELQLLRARVGTRFGDDSARLSDIEDQIAQTDDAMRLEVGRLMLNMENRVAVVTAREASVRRQFNEVEQAYLAWSREKIELSELERERDANRLVYETFLTTFTQNTEMVALQTADARVVNYAEPPRNPVAPRKKVSVVLGLIAGLIAGLGLAFLRAYFNRAIDSAATLRSLLGGVPIFATIPVARGFLRRGDPVKAIGDPRNAALTESIRTLRNMLMIGRAAPGLKIAVMSAMPDEGKTAVSLLLAHAAARAGKTVVVVETDLRRSSIARLLKVPSSPSLDDLLSETDGQILRDLLHKDAVTGAYILPARQVADDPGGLLMSDRMSALIHRLESEFDIVVFDTPPLLSVSDALPVLLQSDEIVLAVRWNKTSQDDLTACLRQLGQAGISPTCAVLTMARRAETGVYLGGYGDATGAAAP